MDEDPPIGAWEDEVWHARGARLIDVFLRAREDGVSLDDLEQVLRPKLASLTSCQRERLRVLAERRMEGPYDHAADGVFWGDEA